MATYTKLFLTGSTNGRPIKVTGTTSGGAVTLHTAVSGTTNKDEIWLYANNTSAAAVELTVMFGGTTSPDDYIIVSVPSKSGLILVVPGFVADNSVVASAFAASANVINITGFVNRITA